MKKIKHAILIALQLPNSDATNWIGDSIPKRLMEPIRQPVMIK